MKPLVRVRGVAAVTATLMALSPFAAPQIYASSVQPTVQSIGSAPALTTQSQTKTPSGRQATARPASLPRVSNSARISTRPAKVTDQTSSKTTKATTPTSPKSSFSVLHHAVLTAKSKVSLSTVQSTSTTTNTQNTSNSQIQSTSQTVSVDTTTAQFTGYVMTADKTPVAGATVDITNGTDTRTLTSGSDGMVQATLAVGKWQIGAVTDSNGNAMTVSSPAAFDVTTDTTVPAVDIIVAPADTVATQAVSGNVYGADGTTPWPNTTFTVSDGTNTVTFTSNARGGYSGKLAPGTWTVTTINSAAVSGSPQTFTVQSGQDLTGANVVDPNGDFVGAVTMDGSTPAANGVLTVVDSQNNQQTVQLDSLGKLHLDLVPGAYQLTSLQYNGDTWFIGETANVTAGAVLSQGYQPRSVVMLGQPNTFITPNTDVSIPVGVTPSTQLDDGVVFKVTLTGSLSNVDLSMNINGQIVPLAFDDSGGALVGDPADKSTRFYLGPDSRLSINGRFAAAGDYGIQVSMLDSQGAELSSDTQTYSVHAPNVNGGIVNEEGFALTNSDVTLSNASGDSVPVMTDSTGKFTTYLPDGTWSVAGVMDQTGKEVSLAQPVSFTVSGGQPDTQNVTVVVSVPIFTGTVMLDGMKPAANAEVYLFKMVSGNLDPDLTPIVVMTDGNGKFSQEVAAGQYYVYEAMDGSGDHLIGKYVTVDSKTGEQTFTTQQISLAGPTEAGAGGVSLYEVNADSSFNQYSNIYFALDVADSQGQTVTSGVKFQTFGNDNEEDFTFNQETGQWTADSSSPVDAGDGLPPLYATFDTPGTYSLTYHVMDASTHQSVASVTQQITIQTPNVTGTVYLADGKTYSPYSYLEFTNSSGGKVDLSTDDRGNFSAYLDPDTWTLTSVDGNTLGDSQQQTIDTSKSVSPLSIADPWEDFNGSVTVGGEPLKGWTLVAFDKYGNEQDVYLNDKGQFIADLPGGDYTAAYVYPGTLFSPFVSAKKQVLSGHTTTSFSLSPRMARSSTPGLSQFMNTWMQRLRLGKLNVNNPSGVTNTTSTSGTQSTASTTLSPKASSSAALSPAISTGTVGDLPFMALVLNQTFSVQTGSLTTKNFEPPIVSLGFENDVLQATDVHIPVQILAQPDSQGYVTVNVQKDNVAAANTDVTLTNTDTSGTTSTLSLDSTGTVSIGSAQNPFTGSPALNLQASFTSSGDYTVTVTYYGVDGNSIGSGTVVEHVHAPDVKGQLISDPGPGLTGLPIANAEVVISQGTSTWKATTDADGNFTAYVPASDMGYNIHQIYDWNGDEVDFQMPYVFNVQDSGSGDPVMMVGVQQKDSNGNVTGVVQTQVSSLTVATSKTTMLTGTADAGGTLVIYPEAKDDTGASTGLPDMSQEAYYVDVAKDGTFRALLPQGDYYITSEETSDGGSLDVNLPVPASDQTSNIDVASALHMTIEAPSSIFPQVTNESYFNAVHVPAYVDISQPVYFVLDVTLGGAPDTQDGQFGMHLGGSGDHYQAFAVNQSTNQLQIGDASNPVSLTPTTDFGLGLNASYTKSGKYLLTLHMYDTSGSELATATQTFDVKSPTVTGTVTNADGSTYGPKGEYIRFENANDPSQYTWAYVWQGNFNVYLPAGDWNVQSDNWDPVVVTQPASSKTIHVDDPTVLQTLTFQVQPEQAAPTQKVSGTVTLPDGTPIPNAGIVLYQTNADKTQTFGNPVFVYADKNGVFSGGIPQGQYLITALFTGDYKVAVDPIYVDASSQDVTGIAVKPEMQAVTGTVVAADRKTPLAGAQVHLVGPLGDVDSAWVTADANGSYSFTGEVGTWMIDEIKYAGSDDMLDDVEQFNPAVSKDPVIVPRVVDPYADFAGQLTVDGTVPAAGWKLHVIQPDGTGADVTLDANGKFVLSESRDGDYILDTITNPSGTVTRSIHKTANVVKGQMSNHVYSVIQNALSGMAYAADGETALPNARVHLTGPLGEDVWLDADGTGTFTGNVAEGSWSIDKVTFASDTETLATPVTFSSTADNANITLQDGVVDPYVDLTGQVQLDDGTGAAGWTLSITGPNNFSKQVTLDADGRFILSLKDDGTYILSSVKKNGTTRDIGTAVTVTHGTLKSQTFKVKPIVTGGGSGTGGSGSGSGGTGSGTGTDTGGNKGGKVTYGTILVTQTVTSSGATLSQNVGNSSVTVDIPANAFQGEQKVELTTTDTEQLSSVVPSGSTAIVGFGVNFNGPAPTVPITLTIKNDSIPAGAQVYKVADDGTLIPVQATVTDGQAVITFSSDPNFVIVKEPVVTPKRDQRVLRFNGKVNVVPAFVDGGTTYMPIWYVMQMLKSEGIESTWDGHHWMLTTTGNPDLSAIHAGTGAMSIYLNGTLVQKVFGKYAVDPSSGQKTTFMPIWYVIQILKRLNITSTWDGTTWTLVKGQ